MLLGLLAVAIFLAAWQAVFLFVPFNPLFISKPDLIAKALVFLLVSGDMLRDLAISAVPFFYGFIAAVVVGVPLGVVMGWRAPVRYTLDPLMTIFYASPLVALAPLVIVFFGVGVSGKAIIIFLLAVFPFIFNAQAGVRAIDPLLINVVRSMGGTEWDLYRKVLVPGVLPYIVAGARIAVGRGLIGILVGEFFAASEGIGYAIARFGDLFALDKMFACIFAIMVIAVVLTEGIRFAERCGVSVAGGTMTDTAALPADLAEAAPARSLWRRMEPTILGTAGIAVLLLAWELVPRIITLKAGTKLFFTTPSQIAGTLWRLFATGEIWGPLGVSAEAFLVGLAARGRRRAAARRADRPLAHAQRHARSVRHRVQRHAAAGVPAAGDAVARPRAVDQGRHRLHRRAVSDPDQHLRGRAQRRPHADQRGALVRRQRMGRGAPRGGAERDAVHHRGLAAGRSAAPCWAWWWRSSSARSPASA